MIGPTRDYADLGILPVPYTVERRPVDLSRSAIDVHAKTVGAALGLIFQPETASGQFIEIEMPDRTRRKLLRVTRYALAKPSEVMGAATKIIEACVRDHGPGRVWCLLEAVHIIADGDTPNTVYGTNVDGEVHLRLRSWIAHEHGPQFGGAS